MAKKTKTTKLKTYCRACGEQQYKEKKVVTCSRGHDGVEGMSKEDWKHRKELRKSNSLNKHIYIQLGDDEDENVNTFYRIIGAQGNLCLRKYQRSSRLDKAGNEEDFDKVDTTYHANLHWICQKILTHETTGVEAITLEQLLEVYKSVEEKLDTLAETIYLLSEDE